MMKRGQVTIFVIIAIVIVVSVGAYFMFRDTASSEEEVSGDVAPIYEFVKSCIDANLEDTVYVMGLGGGYFFSPTLSDVDGFTYYFYEGVNYFPKKSEIEDRMSSSIESDIVVCSNGFKDFPDYEVREGKISVKTEILDNEILFNIKYPLSIKKGESVDNLNDFGIYSVPVRFGLIHSSIEGLIRRGYYSEKSICVDCLTDLVFENGLDVDFLEGGVERSIFVIKDFNETTNKTFEYVFAV